MKACHEGAVSQVKELVVEGTKKPGWIHIHNEVNKKKQEGRVRSFLFCGFGGLERRNSSSFRMLVGKRGNLFNSHR